VAPAIRLPNLSATVATTGVTSVAPNGPSIGPVEDHVTESGAPVSAAATNCCVREAAPTVVVAVRCCTPALVPSVQRPLLAKPDAFAVLFGNSTEPPSL